MKASTPETHRSRGYLNSLSLLALLVTLSTLNFTAIAQEFRLTFSTPLPQTDTQSVGLRWWASEVERRTNGAVKVTAHYGGSLISPTEALAGLNDGRVDLGYLVPAYWPAQFPLWSVASIPFQTYDPSAQMAAFYDTYENNLAFRNEFDKLNMRVLFYFPLAPTVAGTKNKALSSPEDIKGLKLRALGNTASAVTAVGGLPVALGASEVYEAVQRGVIDGFVGWPFTGIASGSLYEVAPYIVDPGIGHYSSSAVAISKRAWDKMPPNIQKTLIDVANEYMKKKAMPDLVDAEEAACKAIMKSRASVKVWSPAATESWKAAVGNTIVRKWLDDAQKAGVDERTAAQYRNDYLAAYQKNAATSTYINGVKQCAGKN